MRPAIAALACGLAAALALGQAAVAARPFNLGDALFGPHAEQDSQKPPPIARYVDEDGDTAFVLDRSTAVPLLRFDDSPEIWVLTPQPGPRGDVIYKNDVGELVLRATRLGGMTLFTGVHPGGAAAALVGEAPPLRPNLILTPNALLQRLAQASARASRAAQRLVVFDAPDVTPQTASLVADAATVTAEAIGAMARDPIGRRQLARLTKVMLVPGRKAQATLDQGVLRVVIAPPAAGALRASVVCRPSSRRIAVALQH
ncbi:MAG: DUF4908 domain-containing protein [Caulobacteraceae bacterium]|nr:DUF4908 domain-containing protein [Caulobacteraceae bacterium]